MGKSCGGSVFFLWKLRLLALFGQTLQNNFHNKLEAVDDNELLITPKTRFAKETQTQQLWWRKKK